MNKSVKIIIKILCITLSIIIAFLVSFGAFIQLKHYICEVKEGFYYKKQHYSYYSSNYLDEDCSFVPFGDNHNHFVEDLTWKKWFFFEYCEEDSEKLFFYDFNLFGNYIFKKDSYSIPENPNPEYINFIRVAYESGERYSDIKDKNDIIEIVSFFNNVNTNTLSYSNPYDSQNEIYIWAYSEKYGGSFNLTTESKKICLINNKIVFTNIDEKITLNVSDILKNYYLVSKDSR